MPAYREGTLAFSTKPTFKRGADGKDHVLCEFKYSITEPSIKSLIEQGKARVCVSVHCRDVVSIKAIDLPSQEYVHAIPAGEVTGKTDFTLFVVANEDINGFTSSNFDDFFAGTYDIEEGSVLAFSEPWTYYLDRAAFKPATSILSLHVNPNTQERVYDVDPNGDNIAILLDEKSYVEIQKARDVADPNITTLLVNGLYQMAVVKGIEYLQKEPEVDKPWARVLSNLIEASEDISLSDDSHIIAQRLLKNPIGDFGSALLKMEGDFL